MVINSDDKSRWQFLRITTTYINNDNGDYCYENDENDNDDYEGVQATRTIK